LTKNEQTKKTYSKTNTSPFALTSEWRVKIVEFAYQQRAACGKLRRDCQMQAARKFASKKSLCSCTATTAERRRVINTVVEGAMQQR